MPLICTKNNLLNAASKGDLKSVKTHLKSRYFKQDWFGEGMWGLTPLFYAAQNGHVEIVSRLIEAGADVNHACKGSWTALIVAAKEGRLDVVDVIVKSDKIDVNFVTPEGNSALHFAVSNNHPEIVGRLLDHGANVNVVNREGLTVLDIAKNKQYLEIKKMIERHLQSDVEAVSWKMIGDDKAAHISFYPEVQRKLTEIFNFNSRERIVISENMDSKMETVSTPESFDGLNEGVLQAAYDAFKQQGGKVDEAHVFKHSRLANKKALFKK